VSGYTFSETPPSQWDATCERTGALFHSRDWQTLLEHSFGCRPLYAWDAESGPGAALSVFKAGPFHIAYLGFPVGGMLGDAHGMLDWGGQASVKMPTCVRIPVSAFADPVELPLAFESNPETAIRDLQDWDLASVSKNLRRDVKKAQRSGLSIEVPSDAAEGKSLFRIYRETVERHSGALRYNEGYFSALIELARRQSRLRVLVARYEGSLAGFIVVGIDRGTAYYLHGGTDIAHRQHSPADLLLNESINQARNDGCQCFNLMSSPNDQPTLVKYKEKWGGETRQHRTYTLPLRSSYRLFRIAEGLYRWIR
jgi:hypothetical protein